MRSGLWTRVFVGLFFAVLPPILLLVGAVVLSESLLSEADPAVLSVMVVLGAVAWAAVLAVAYARVLSDEVRSLVQLAVRGGPGHDSALGTPAAQLAATLEERTRQVSTLARRAGEIPLGRDPAHVISTLVSTARSVMGDPTWRCAVLSADDVPLLPSGVYGAPDDGEPEAVGDLERWASASSPELVAYIEGPWGAFSVVGISAGDRVKGVLYAPWEGRAPPSPADIALMTLLGQVSATALEHSLLYAQVRSQADELNRMAAIQADFLRGVTHDLQTPLTSIGALAGEMQAHAGLPYAVRADLDTITHQADRLRRMVSQLLTASRVEAGVVRPATEVFAVVPVIQRTWLAMRADRPFEVADLGPPHLAVGDPDRLEQVMWAVLDNAVKYSPPGSPVSVRVEPNGDRLEITVVDAGAGIDAETRDHAFDQFYRAEHARRLAPDGSGVGLYAARGLMEAMGGTIDISGELGGGATVRMTLPAEPAQAEDT